MTNNIECLSTQQMDKLLLGTPNGVRLSLDRAKNWSKYTKELLAFVQKRLQLESEHAKAVYKLSEGVRTFAHDQNFLPLQEIYISSFRMEAEFYDKCVETAKSLYEYKYIKPLQARREEHERKRKQMERLWEGTVKQVYDTKCELKKAHQNFISRDLSYKKAKEDCVKLDLNQADKAKADKRRKLEVDTLAKRDSANRECEQLEKKLRQKCEELEAVEKGIISNLRELAYQCDQTTKATTVAYFNALSALWALPPIQNSTLANSAKEYVPGTEYMQFLHSLPGEQDQDRWSSDKKSSLHASEDDMSLITKERPHRNRSHTEISAPFSPTTATKESTDDDRSLGDPQNEGAYFPKSMVDSAVYSEAARTHKLEKARAPGKCAHCESYTFFQTAQCSDCGMTWHHKCLATVNVTCGPKAKNMAISARMSIFGVPLQAHLMQHGNIGIPIILQQCVPEVERRGVFIKGLYRVSGVKSKIEQLCEEFERCTEVDLTNHNPANIACLIKHYLRQLPEPLLTERLYGDFVQIAKSFPPEHEYQWAPENAKNYSSMIIAQLKHTLLKMPRVNRDSIKYLCLHLKRITWFESENQMNASNLGIVFGPTLMWSESSGSPLNSLLDAPYQARAIELLIRHCYPVFKAEEEAERSEFIRLTSIDPLNYEAAVKECDGDVEAISKGSLSSTGTDASGMAHLKVQDKDSLLSSNSATSSSGADQETRPRTSVTPDILKDHSASLQQMSHPKLERQINPAVEIVVNLDQNSEESQKFDRSNAGRQKHMKKRAFTTSILVSPRIEKRDIHYSTAYNSDQNSDDEEFLANPSSSNRPPIPPTQQLVTVKSVKGQLVIDGANDTHASNIPRITDLESEKSAQTKRRSFQYGGAKKDRESKVESGASEEGQNAKLGLHSAGLLFSADSDVSHI